MGQDCPRFLCPFTRYMLKCQSLMTLSYSSWGPCSLDSVQTWGQSIHKFHKAVMHIIISLKRAWPSLIWLLCSGTNMIKKSKFLLSSSDLVASQRINNRKQWFCKTGTSCSSIAIVGGQCVPTSVADYGIQGKQLRWVLWCLETWIHVTSMPQGGLWFLRFDLLLRIGSPILRFDWPRLCWSHGEI